MVHVATIAPCDAGLLVGASAAVPGANNAILVITILEVGSNIVIEASGSLPGLLSSGDTFNCDRSAIDTTSGLLCTGHGGPAMRSWDISGPSSFSPLAPTYRNADTSSGIKVALWAGVRVFGIDLSYNFGDPIVSSATFENFSLVDFGITEHGLIGSWTIKGSTQGIELYARRACG